MNVWIWSGVPESAKYDSVYARRYIGKYKKANLENHKAPEHHH